MKDEQTEMFAFATCENCKREVLADDTTIVEKYAGETTLQLRFCGEACSTEYYLDSLRNAGI